MGLERGTGNGQKKTGGTFLGKEKVYCKLNEGKQSGRGNVLPTEKRGDIGEILEGRGTLDS